MIVPDISGMLLNRNYVIPVYKKHPLGVCVTICFSKSALALSRGYILNSNHGLNRDGNGLGNPNRRI